MLTMSSKVMVETLVEVCMGDTLGLGWKIY
jgi:hypothetical protein